MYDIHGIYEHIVLIPCQHDRLKLKEEPRNLKSFFSDWVSDSLSASEEEVLTGGLSWMADLHLSPAGVQSQTVF